MNKERLHILLKKNQEGDCTEDESMELDDWFHKVNHNELNFGDWLIAGGGEEVVKKRMFSEFNQNYITKSRSFWFGPIYKIVAVLVLTGCTLLIYNYYKSRSNVDSLSAKEDIIAGGNRAILTLPDGKKISLIGGKASTVAEQSGVTILNTGEGSLEYKISNVGSDLDTIRYNTIETPKGGSIKLFYRMVQTYG
ncbi:hypothetical protein G7074_00540 [Pedobacter sp. HDW13]|uniref:hypothetical protein n=1 Tax=Pedobacter sp. HDW13 TaxID=2714940 RepID=UPI00140D328C|nr:hypothetical protein [Pedobacter sp. HDW13]QIL37901.1 hypothetical protein G7074_00540 [Pedobacter sp. HDW13]